MTLSSPDSPPTDVPEADWAEQETVAYVEDDDIR